MWGSAILVAPKITQPNAVLIAMKKQSVNYYLPRGYLWYNYDSKVLEKKLGSNFKLLDD